MSEPRWIVIPNWDGEDGFQHYSKREPIWIKNYRSLMSKDEYLELSFHARGVLHGLWLQYAASNRQLIDKTSTLTRQLGQRVSRRDLDSLNHAGFIEFSASKPLARRYQAASPEKKRELKEDLKAGAHAPTPNGQAFAAKVVADPKGREHRPYHADRPTDPTARIKKLIGRTIHDRVDLDTELRALGINGAEAESLRALLPESEAA